jgi:hypothetical protein
VLLPFTFGGMPAYQNYVLNAYLWLLVGILFRLPHLVNAPASGPRPLKLSFRARRQLAR